MFQVVVGSEDLAANHDVMQIVEVQILNTCEAYVIINCFILLVKYMLTAIETFPFVLLGLGRPFTRWALGCFARKIPQIPRVSVGTLSPFILSLADYFQT